jgi:cytochrome c
VPAAPVTATAAFAAALQAELAALPPGSADAGKTEFTAAGCAACHSLQAGVRIVGPALAGVAARAAGRKPGYSAPLYLYESVTRPNAYVLAGFPAGLMPPDFRSRLRPQDLSDLLAFLLTES